MPPTPICSPARAKARILHRPSGISRARPRPIPSPTTPGDTLRVFMSFITTLVHSTSHSGRLPGPDWPYDPCPRSQAPLSVAPRGPSSRGPRERRQQRPQELQQKRGFHNYFVTHLPSSSLHPDTGSRPGPHHKLPRSASTPHTSAGPGHAPASPPNINVPSRDLTVVRIPLRSAKHHFGVYNSRGDRVYNEDTNQAGTIDLPAFARRAPVSLSRSGRASAAPGSGVGNVADSPSSGDPQIFYFAVFDGHGGAECSEFLRDELHTYIEQAAVAFGLGSSLRKGGKNRPNDESGSGTDGGGGGGSGSVASSAQAPQEVEIKSAEEVRPHMQLPDSKDVGVTRERHPQTPAQCAAPLPVPADTARAQQLERELVGEYKNTIGGYFRRFRPAHFSLGSASSGKPHSPPSATDGPEETAAAQVTIESVLTYAFLRADLDFVTAQARKPDPDDPKVSDFPLNRDEILGAPHLPSSSVGIGGPTRFKGGSTASIALFSTPTPAPFWHPAAHSTLLVAHVGDTRILLCETATGLPRALTSDHHPSTPSESRRLRRFAADSLATDSFGEERFSGLANSRSFGDMQSKRVGVSAEPELCRTEIGPAEYSFLVLASDGVSGSLSDQEIVDIVKEARTPEQGARDVVEYATEVSIDGDNATCLVVRLGGWERRSEGGLGSMGTKEIRDVRKAEAEDPRRGRR